MCLHFYLSYPRSCTYSTGKHRVANHIDFSTSKRSIWRQYLVSLVWLLLWSTDYVKNQFSVATSGVLVKTRGSWWDCLKRLWSRKQKGANWLILNLAGLFFTWTWTLRTRYECMILWIWSFGWISRFHKYALFVCPLEGGRWVHLFSFISSS